ncbi:MAG: hypothetical protein HXY47_06040 [Nitrospirae bacterium]|nr:hypothetical protein [Nitrospirota bacterium]
MLKKRGFRVVILDASVEFKKRDMDQQTTKDMDALVVNAKMVKTGLNY